MTYHAVAMPTSGHKLIMTKSVQIVDLVDRDECIGQIFGVLEGWCGGAKNVDLFLWCEFQGILGASQATGLRQSAQLLSSIVTCIGSGCC